jgi:hypothetical protein
MPADAREMNDDYEDFKSRSEADCKTILEIAKRGLTSPELDHDDRDSLERAIYFLEKGFRVLARIADQSNEGKLARQALCEMMGAAFLIGSAGTYTGGAILYFRADQVKRARDAKLTKNAERKPALDKAVVNAAKRLNEVPAKSQKFYDKIRDEIAVELGYSPGKSTVFKSVQRIRESAS